MNQSKFIKTVSRISFAITILTAFAFGIKQLREPDIFWQLRTGQWILENKTVMGADIFSYTFHNAPWINVKWGFEVLIYLLYTIGGVEFTPVLQCIASVMILILFFQLFKLIYKRISGGKADYQFAGFLVTAILFLLGCAYRMNGRPEMVSHVLTGLFLLILLRYNFRPSNWIFVLVPLQIIWANMHEAFGTGEIMAVVMAASTWIEFFYKKDKNISKPARLSIVAGMVVLAPALSPYGLSMIAHPYAIFSQVQENKFTTELYSFLKKEYWEKEAWLNIFFLITGVIGLFLPYKAPGIAKGDNESKSQKWYLRPFAAFGGGYVLLFVMFFYLSLTAYRNIIFFIILSAPLTANCLCFIALFFKTKFKIFSKTGFQSAIYLILLCISIFFYVSVPTNFFYAKAEKQNNHFGLRTDPLMNPVGAAQFIKDNHITGKCFDDFLISNYLLWALRPDFKTFIDLRDLDVFPAAFFKDFALISYFPQKLDQVDSLYHFNYAVVYRNNFQNLHSYFYHNKNWIMAYADPVSIVYIKRNEANNALISKLKSTNSDNDFFHAPTELKPSVSASFFTNILWPGANIDYNKNTDYDLIAASYYLSVGNTDLATKKATLSINKNTLGALAFMGDVLLYKYNIDTALQAKQTDLSQAENDYNLENDKDKKNVKSLIGLARVSLTKNDLDAALSYLHKSIKFDPNEKDAYVLMANCLSQISQHDNSNAESLRDQRIKAMEKALSLDPDDISLRFYLGLSYGHGGDCEKAVEYLKATINIPGLNPDDVKEAEKSFYNAASSFIHRKQQYLWINPKLRGPRKNSYS